MRSRRANIRRLARRCRAIVDSLSIPDPFDAREMCRTVGEQRGRPVVVAPLDLTTVTHCGLWLNAREADYIFFEATTSPVHQDHIILHELGHVLCHEHNGTLDSDALRRIFPALDTELVRNALGRMRYTTIEEQEAEVFAHLVLDEVWRDMTEEEPTHDVVRRFAARMDG